MTPLWLETHSSHIDSNRSTTADHITFNAGSIRNAALLKVPLVTAGVLVDETPLSIEITVANDVSIGGDSDIRYGVSDGINFIGFETMDTWNYRDHSPCFGTEALSGETLTAVTSFNRFSALSAAITNFFPKQFVFTLKLDQPWGSCLTAHGGGSIKTAEYSKRLLVSRGLSLEVYKSDTVERVGIKFFKVIIMKTDS